MKKVYPLLDQDTFPENEEEVKKAMEQIKELGGILLFDVEKSDEGWVAQCQQVPGIITGGTNPDPGEYEIESQIRDAVQAALHVNTRLAPDTFRTQKTITQLALSLG